MLGSRDKPFYDFCKERGYKENFCMMENLDSQTQNIETTVEKLAGFNERLDDILLELATLKDYMPDEDDVEDYQKYNKPVNLPPLKEDKWKENNKISSNHPHQSDKSDKKTN